MRESADEPPRRGGENDEELGKWIDGSAEAPADKRSGRRAELPARPSQREAVRFVVAPVVAHGTSLGLTVASAAHGHVKIASLAPQSPLAGKLWPGEVVIIIDGESTTHLTPDEAQQRLDDAPGVQHNLLICAEEGEEEDDGTLTVDNAGVQRTQLVREPSIAKTFAPPPSAAAGPRSTSKLSPRPRRPRSPHSLRCPPRSPPRRIRSLEPGRG